MSLNKLDHVNVRTAKLEQMKDFYQNALGMTVGARPPFSFPGAWLYVQDQPVIHLVGVNDQQVLAEDDSACSKLRLEHFAFSADGSIDDFKSRLQRVGVAHDTMNPPGTDLTQLHLRDPDGNHIHIDFQN